MIYWNWYGDICFKYDSKTKEIWTLRYGELEFRRA